MTLISALRGIRNSIENPSVPLTDVRLVDWLAGPRSRTGKTVNEHTAYGMPAVWRAVNLIAGTCASLPLAAFRAEGAAKVRQETGIAAELLADPHPDLTPFDLWELAFATVLTWGNVAFLKQRRALDGAVRELWWVEPSRIKYHRAGNDDGVPPGTKLYVLDGDLDRPLTDRDVLHIPGFGYDGTCGAPPIRLHREGIGLALAAEEYGSRLFGSGSLATGILTTDQRLDPDQAAQLKERFKAGQIGLDSAHDVRVLGSGAKFQQLSIPPQDAQFIESRRFQISEVARIFGVPPHLLGETDKTTSWGSGIEEQNIGFVTYTLRQWLTRFEQRLTKHLLSPGPVYAKYSVEGLLRGNSAARSAFYREMWNLGVLSTNDIRAYEELPPVKGGNVRYRPLNMGVLGQADPPPAPPTEPAAPASEPEGGTDA